MPALKPRIVLYGHFGSGNIGNDSSLEAALHHSRKYQPNADLLCVCNGPQEITRRFGIKAEQIGRLHNTEDRSTGSRVVRLVKKVWARLAAETGFWFKNPAKFKPGDLFMVVGTGAVDDMAVRHPWNAPYELYKWCKTARLGGARVMFLSVGVGPIQHPASRFLMLRALRMAQYRSYRDQAAFDYLHSVGFDTTGDPLYPDLVFSLPLELAAAGKKSTSQPKVVGLGLINYYGWRHDPQRGEGVFLEYITKIKHFVTWLLEAGYAIRIISGDAIDQRPVQEVIEHVRQAGNAGWQERLIVEPIDSVDELFRQLVQTDIVVASRFHNVLCSLMVGLPVISLGYHEKNVALMKEMGLENYCQHIENFTFDQLVEQFNAYSTAGEQVSQRIQKQCQRYRHLLDEQYSAIFTPPATHPETNR